MKISICEAAPQGACSYYRSIGPLTKLRHINPKIQTQILSTVTWNNLFDTDILFLARPDSQAFIEMAEIAKNLNIPVWVDWDDNIFKIPPYNPAYKHYKKKSTIKAIETCIELADTVTVSTQNLKEFYLTYNKNIVIIENAFNDYNYAFEKVSNQFNSIFWRGSNTHRQDLLSVAQQIFGLSKKYKEWTWVFVGGDPWYITDNIKNIFILNEIDVITYNKFLKDNKSAITQVPLLVNEFNESKSNIAWIEGTSAGSAVIAPELPEFQKPGIINYAEKNGSYEYYMEKLIKSKEYRIKNYSKSFDYISENLMLSTINQKRIRVMENLLWG